MFGFGVYPGDNLFLTSRSLLIQNLLRHLLVQATNQDDRPLEFDFRQAVAYLRSVPPKGVPVYVIVEQWPEPLRVAAYPEIRLATRAIPLLGTVSAGKPLEPFEDRNHVIVPKILLSSGENFALRVRGDSMVEDGIRDGDVLVVKRQATAENGQTVVAVVNGEATVKRFYREAGRVDLRPANPLAKPIVLESGAVEIRGVVIGLIRRS